MVKAEANHCTGLLDADALAALPADESFHDSVTGDCSAHAAL
jgi:hypothetical protein